VIAGVPDPSEDVLMEEMLRALESSPDALASARRALDEGLERRGIRFGEGLLPTYPLPFLMRADRVSRWARQSERLAARVEALAQRALEDRELFDALQLRPEAQEFIRVDPGYKRITMLSRPDAILRADELVFLEFNCDSPAMMSFADLVTDCLLELPALAPFRGRLQAENRTAKLLESLLECYREYGARRWPPTIAITDWDGQKTRFEHRRLAEAFEAAGYPTVVCDPRAFRRLEGRLHAGGKRIDIVYRRALFNELVERRSEVVPLLDAYREGSICMVNSMRSYLASSKTLLAEMSDEQMRAEPTDDDGSGQVATTMIVSSQLARRLEAERERWVLKKSESHGGEHVLLPDLVDDAQWRDALKHAAKESWVMQEYCRVPTLALPAERDGHVERERKFYNWNPFLFGGRYAGSIARASETPLINITLGGGLLPTVLYS
jgi:hypothetical protein